LAPAEEASYSMSCMHPVVAARLSKVTRRWHPAARSGLSDNRQNRPGGHEIPAAPGPRSGCGHTVGPRTSSAITRIGTKPGHSGDNDSIILAAAALPDTSSSAMYRTSRFLSSPIIANAKRPWHSRACLSSMETGFLCRPRDSPLSSRTEPVAGMMANWFFAPDPSAGSDRPLFWEWRERFECFRR
jgi:hypothetical protein